MTPHLVGQCVSFEGQCISQPQEGRANRLIEADGQQRLASRLPAEPAARFGCASHRLTWFLRQARSLVSLANWASRCSKCKVNSEDQCSLAAV